MNCSVCIYIYIYMHMHFYVQMNYLLTYSHHFSVSVCRATHVVIIIIIISPKLDNWRGKLLYWMPTSFARCYCCVLFFVIHCSCMQIFLFYLFTAANEVGKLGSSGCCRSCLCVCVCVCQQHCCKSNQPVSLKCCYDWTYSVRVTRIN